MGFAVPAPLLSQPAVRAFNAFWFRKAPERRRNELQPLEVFFYPLDGIAQWNRAYGRNGLLQWQCVLPFGEEHRLVRIVRALTTCPAPVTVAVLKRFGEASPGPLSFPLPGWTLAADFPVARGVGLDGFLDRLDLDVADGGGRIYLAKDSRMRPELLPVMYPRVDEWRAVQTGVDPFGRLTSDLDRRLGLTSRAVQRLSVTAGGE
jgi:decaprenylphospho-beta-D-ribofuranose 2-oxidase